jgi:transcriptional regulator with XRE-family HTH domain
MAQPERAAAGDNHADAFAAFIAAARERKQWTQADLARRSGVSQVAIRRWEAGEETRPDPDQLRAVAQALGVDPRLAAVALGFLAASEAYDLLADDVNGLLAQLRDRALPAALKAAAVDRLRAMTRGQVPPSLLDVETLRLLEELAVVDHQKPADMLATLIRAEYDRRFPGKREYASEPLEIRRARVRQMMGWPETLPDDPEAERSLDAALAAVEVEARRFYGEDADQAAA